MDRIILNFVLTRWIEILVSSKYNYIKYDTCWVINFSLHLHLFQFVSLFEFQKQGAVEQWGLSW